MTIANVVKYGTMVAALIGAVSGLWATYTTFEMSKFKQPFYEHQQLAKSFLAEVTSAEARKDASEANRIRVRYEKFEEKWRASMQIAQIVAPVESLSVSQLSNNQSQHLKELLAAASQGQSQPDLSARTLGAAYFAVKDYKAAVVQLNAATSQHSEPEALALKAAAYSSLAANTSNLSDKKMYSDVAADSFSKALKVTKNVDQLSEFTIANPSLKAVLNEKGVEIKKH